MKKLVLILAALGVLLVGCGDKGAQSSVPAGASSSAVSSADANTQSDGWQSGTGKSDAGAPLDPDATVITDKVFIAQTNDIYINSDDYIGKTIKYEGMFGIIEDPVLLSTVYIVYRFGPGCCGNDGQVGFEVTWDKGYPQPNDWVEVVGVLERYEQNGMPFLRLAITSLTVLPTRGLETVVQ